MMRDKHEAILRDVEALVRGPMQRHLATLLGIEHSPQALQAFADKYPDRYAQAVAIWARMCGYSEAPALTVNLYAKVSSLSDSELERAYLEMQAQLHALQGSHNAQHHALPAQVVDSKASSDVT